LLSPADLRNRQCI